MNRKRIEQIPSETALFAALRRTIANKEYNNEQFGPDYLAEIFLPVHYRFFLKFEKVRKNTKNKLARFMPGMNEYMIARTAFFDRLFVNALNNRTPQIVVLGAGYDSRAYRSAKLNHGSRVFELDTAPTQDRKKKCLKAARINVPQDVKFVPVDFTKESLNDVLEKAGYQNREKTLFIWEGVSYYLDLESIKKTLEFVSHSLHKDTVIAFDYTIPVTEDIMNNDYGAKEFMKTMKEHHANEELLFSIKNGEIGSFLAETNLRMIEYMDNAAIERKYLIDENGSLIGRMTGNFRFVCASPLKQ
jgi:methyltransferase (TIGR00027 family)